MRELGVVLDQRLTFGEHVEYTARKANRALGLLMRTFETGKRGRSLNMSQHRKRALAVSSVIILR